MIENNNYLLLDIDGVLNNYTTDRYGPYTDQSIQQLKNMIENDKFKNDDTWWNFIFNLEISNLQSLRIIIKKYSITHIIVCSIWRHVFSLTHLRLLFIAKGFPDIAALMCNTTDICSKEYRDRFKMSKRERTIEIANFVESYPFGYEGKWYVLDDDVTEDDINAITSIKSVKSLYFEFKATLHEYKRRESMLLEEMTTSERAIHPLEKDAGDDDEMTKEIKSRHKAIKSAILDPNLNLVDMAHAVSSIAHELDITTTIYKMALKDKNESKRKHNKRSK